MNAIEAYEAAQRELVIAQNHFDQADPDHIDVAVHKLKAAEIRFDVALRAVKAS